MSVRELSSKTAASLRSERVPNSENTTNDEFGSARPKKLHKISKCCSKICIHVLQQHKYVQAGKMKTNDKT